MIPVLTFALQHFGLIASIVKEGITIGPEIAKLVSDGYEVVTRIHDEGREPTAAEWAELEALEEYWRTRFHSDE